MEPASDLRFRSKVGHGRPGCHQIGDMIQLRHAGDRPSHFSVLFPYLPQPASLAGKPHARARHRIQATHQCLLEMLSPRSPARTRRLADPSRSGDLRPKVAGAPHAILHRKRARACSLPAPQSHAPIRKCSTPRENGTTPIRQPWACLQSRCGQESCRDRVSRLERHNRSAD
jgi:hypothetical protein